MQPILSNTVLLPVITNSLQCNSTVTAYSEIIDSLELCDGSNNYKKQVCNFGHSISKSEP
jgi:hypothetical protein